MIIILSVGFRNHRCLYAIHKVLFFISEAISFLYTGRIGIPPTRLMPNEARTMTKTHTMCFSFLIIENGKSNPVKNLFEEIVKMAEVWSD